MKFTKDHEWAKLEGDLAVIGITDYAAEQLGDIVFVELPSVGDKVKQGTPSGTIESVKTVSDLICAVTGEVVEINEELESEPEVVNEDPFGKGWFMKVKLSNPEEMDGLLSEEDYRKLCE